MTTPPSESESDTNLSPQRRAWAEKNLDPEAQTLLAEDEKYFLRQSVSTPCLNAIVKAEGIWIEDTAGRRAMDFHGNNVHHIGYGHPRLKRAIAEQMDALPFAPRRYTCGPAVALAAKLAEIAPGKPTEALRTASKFFRDHGVQSRPTQCHGIDLVTDNPHVSAEHVKGEAIDMLLKPGMIIMAEPNPITPDGNFGIFLGHTFIVTPDGHEAVDKFPLEIAVSRW